MGSVKFVGKAVAPTNVAKGLGTGIKEGWKGGKLFGAPVMPKSWSAKARKAKGEEREAYFKGFGSGGYTGASAEKKKFLQKQINEKVAKNKEEKMSRSAALKDIEESKDEATRVAAAASLAQMDNGIQTMEDLSKALNALNDPTTGKVADHHKERAAEIISKADKKVIATTTTKDHKTGATITTSGLQHLTKVIDTLGKDNQKAISDLIGKLEDPAFEGSGADAKALADVTHTIAPALAGALKTKMVKEGGAKVLVDSLTIVDPATGGPLMSDQAAVEQVLRDIKSVKDVVASASLFQDARYGSHAKNFVNDPSKTPPLRQQEIRKAAAQESANPAIFF